jgi:hypothetical protein
MPMLPKENMSTDPGNILIAHKRNNVEIRTAAAQFLFREYMNGTFVAVLLHDEGPCISSADFTSSTVSS